MKLGVPLKTFHSANKSKDLTGDPTVSFATWCAVANKEIHIFLEVNLSSLVSYIFRRRAIFFRTNHGSNDAAYTK